MQKFLRVLRFLILGPLAPIVVISIGAFPLFILQQIAANDGAAMILPMIAAVVIGRLYRKVPEYRASAIFVGLVLVVMVMQRGFYPAFFYPGDGLDGFLSYNQMAGLALLAVSFSVYRLMQLAQGYLPKR